MKFEIPCHVKDNKPNNAKKLNEAFRALNGKDVIVTIQKRRSKRSNAQNDFFHGVVIPIVQQGYLDAGWNEARSADWTKAEIKKFCLIRQAVNEKTGEVKDYVGDTSGLTKSEFMDFIADIQQWAAENLGIYVPDPNEQTELFNDTDNLHI